MMKALRKIFNYKYFLSVFIITKYNLKSQYQSSYLGILWSLIHPIVFIFVTSIVFSTIMRFPFADHILYMTSGVVSWNLLVNSLNMGSISFARREALIKRAVISKTIFPVSDVLSSIYVFFLSLIAVFFVVNLLILQKINVTVLLIPFAILPLLVSSLAGSIFFAYVTPYFKDISHFLNVGLNVFFWTMPIAYPLQIVPEDKRIFFEYNPIYLLISPIHDVMYYGVIPSFTKYFTSCCIAGIILTISYLSYLKLRKKVIYYL